MELVESAHFRIAPKSADENRAVSDNRNTAQVEYPAAAKGRISLDAHKTRLRASKYGVRQMLQRNRTEYAFGPAEQDHLQAAGIGELVDFGLGFARRQYLIILVAAVLGAAAGVGYLLVIPASYTAHAKVIVGTQKAQFVQQQSIFTDEPIDSAQLESQLQILKSKAIAAAVVQKLKLVDDPEFVSPETESSVWVDWIRDTIRDIRKLFAGSASPPPTTDELQMAVDALADRLAVKRAGTSYVIDIAFRSRSPEKSATIANAIAREYLADQFDAKAQANITASTWLQERLRQLGEQSVAAEQEVLAFKQRNNIVAAAGKRMDEQSLADLHGRLVAARTQTADLLARLNRLESIISTWNANSSLDATISDSPATPILTGLRQQYLDLVRREAEYSAKYGRDHLAVVNLRNRMRELRSATLDELRRLTETFRNDYEIAKQRQTEIEGQVEQALSESQTTDKAQVMLRELESTAGVYRTLYQTFLQRHMAGLQQNSFPIPEARVVSLASVPTDRDTPKPPVVLALAFMGGIVLGGGIGLLRELTGRVFRTGAQVESALQIPCLALVPLLKKTSSEASRKVACEALGRNVRRGSSALWKAVDAPFSSYAEAIRAVRLGAGLKQANGGNKIIGLTSSLPNEGKSTIAAALAQVTAQTGSRVIIVDCDLRCQTLSRALAPEASIGLVDILSGHRTLDEAVRHDRATNLAFLPAAAEGSPKFRTSEMLGGAPSGRLFDELRARYDFVIVDLPPLAPVVDVRAATHLVDCMILVIEWGRTKIDVVHHSLNTAPDVHERVVGAVLNKTDMKLLLQYDRHRASVYKNEHYERYGYTHD